MASDHTRAVVSRKKREAFLEALARTGRVMDSALAAGYTDTTYLQKMRREDEEFAEQWADALESAADVLEDEAVRRAVSGVEEPVFYKGKVVGYKLNYSDQLMMFMLRGMRPDKFNNRGSTDVNVNFGVAVLPMTMTNEDDWEKNAVEVHSTQKLIEIEDKPVESVELTNKIGRS